MIQIRWQRRGIQHPIKQFLSAWNQNRSSFGRKRISSIGSEKWLDRGRVCFRPRSRSHLFILYGRVHINIIHRFWNDLSSRIILRRCFILELSILSFRKYLMVGRKMGCDHASGGFRGPGIGPIYYFIVCSLVVR
jgi:hypothetical protein